MRPGPPSVIMVAPARAMRRPIAQARPWLGWSQENRAAPNTVTQGQRNGSVEIPSRTPRQSGAPGRTSRAGSGGRCGRPWYGDREGEPERGRRREVFRSAAPCRKPVEYRGRESNPQGPRRGLGSSRVEHPSGSPSRGLGPNDQGLEARRVTVARPEPSIAPSRLPEVLRHPPPCLLCRHHIRALRFRALQWCTLPPAASANH